MDPVDQLLMGHANAMPNALDRAGMTLADVDLVDMHESAPASAACAPLRCGRGAPYGV